MKLRQHFFRVLWRMIEPIGRIHPSPSEMTYKQGFMVRHRYLLLLFLLMPTVIASLIIGWVTPLFLIGMFIILTYPEEDFSPLLILYPLLPIVAFVVVVNPKNQFSVNSFMCYFKHLVGYPLYMADVDDEKLTMFKDVIVTNSKKEYAMLLLKHGPEIIVE